MRFARISARGVELIAEVLADLDPAFPPFATYSHTHEQLVMDVYGERARAIAVVFEENPGEIDGLLY